MHAVPKQVLFATCALLPEGWAKDVLVEVDSTGRVAAVTPNASPSAGAEQVGPLFAAPSNIHSHGFQRAMAGLTESRGADPTDSFWTWRQVMYRFLDQLKPDDVQAITAFVQKEMLEAGYGRSVEFHYLHHQPGGKAYDNLAELSDRVCAASADSGIGLTLLPVLYQYGGMDGRPLGPGQNRFGNTVDSFATLLNQAEKGLAALPQDARLGVAPHSLRAVSAEGLAAATQMRPDGPLHMHIAEQLAEIEEVRAAAGARPVEWLLANHDVDDRWCLIHCTHMTGEETRALAASGATAGLCPITESSLGDGIFNGIEFMRSDGRIGIGSDSNIRISLSEELRTLEYSQRLQSNRRAVFATAGKSTGRVLLEATQEGGAAASGQDTGTIAVGQLADLFSLDANSVHLVNRTDDQILDAFIFAGDDTMVQEVWSAGRHLVSNGRHRNRDRIEASYRRTLQRLSTQL
jgi:formimidoylglutamate deiminase